MAAVCETNECEEKKNPEHFCAGNARRHAADDVRAATRGTFADKAKHLFLNSNLPKKRNWRPGNSKERGVL